MLTSERDRIGLTVGALEEDSLVWRGQQHALGAPLVEVAPAVRAGPIDVDRMMGMLDGHHPTVAPDQFGCERNRECGLPRVLPPDYGDDPSRRHRSSALARSSAVFTLKN